jgi:hypothetical protein
VYSARVDAKGGVGLVEGKVKRIVETPRGRVLETTLPASKDAAVGAPIFDAQARVLAVTSLGDDGRPMLLLPPEAWRGPMTDRSAAGKAAREAAEQAKQEELEEATKPKPVDDLGRPVRRPSLLSADPQASQGKLEKTYRERKLPDDL